MSAEEADKTATTDASGGDEEEEWLYGGKKMPSWLRNEGFTVFCRGLQEMVHDYRPE